MAHYGATMASAWSVAAAAGGRREARGPFPQPARLAAQPGGTPVGQDPAGPVAARDPRAPAPGVGGRPSLVQAGDRGGKVGVAGRRAGVEHLAQAELAVE